MHFAHAVNATGIEQNPFRRGRFAGVNMSNNSDITYVV
jgi:hypothetical protein